MVAAMVVSFGVFGYQCIAKLGGLACDYIPNANRTCLIKEFEPCVMIDGGSQVMPAGDEKALAAALVKQPIAVAVDASHTSFQLYASGVYYEPACSSEKLDHAMLLAGYGTLDGEDYWLVKNSWGEWCVCVLSIHYVIYVLGYPFWAIFICLITKI